eukprot:3765494-Amphidinium_carterae.1
MAVCLVNAQQATCLSSRWPPTIVGEERRALVETPGGRRELVRAGDSGEGIVGWSRPICSSCYYHDSVRHPAVGYYRKGGDDNEGLASVPPAGSPVFRDAAYRRGHDLQLPPQIPENLRHS